MTELDLIREEIAEIEAQIFRLKASMNKGDNGVKLYRIRVISRTLDRLKALDRRNGEGAAS